MTTKAATAPPSAMVRATLSLALLVGFYVVIFGLAAALFALPIALIAATRINWATVAFLMCTVRKDGLSRVNPSKNTAAMRHARARFRYADIQPSSPSGRSTSSAIG